MQYYRLVQALSLSLQTGSTELLWPQITLLSDPEEGKTTSPVLGKEKQTDQDWKEDPVTRFSHTILILN